MSAIIDTFFLHSVTDDIITDAAATMASAIDVLDSFSDMEFDSITMDALHALESSIATAIETACDVVQNYTEYVTVSATTEESDEESVNDAIDYALDYHEMLD